MSGYRRLPLFKTAMDLARQALGDVGAGLPAIGAACRFASIAAQAAPTKRAAHLFLLGEQACLRSVLRLGSQNHAASQCA